MTTYREHNEVKLQNLVLSGLSWERKVSLAREIALVLTGCMEACCVPYQRRCCLLKPWYIISPKLEHPLQGKIMRFKMGHLINLKRIETGHYMEPLGFYVPVLGAL